MANGFTIAATILKNVSGIESPKYRNTIINGIIKPSVENTAVITAESVIENILPMIISTEEIFVEIKVSIVPLSFSPAPISMAGYIDPCSTYAIKRKAIRAPINVPANSSSVVKSSSSKLIGFKTDSSIFNCTNLSETIFDS